MRIGNRFGGAVLWSMVALISAPWALGADGVERVQTVPLGGSLPDQSGDRPFGVYIPTRFGGEPGDGALHCGDDVRPGRAEREEALELLLLADQGRCDS